MGVRRYPSFILFKDGGTKVIHFNEPKSEAEEGEDEGEAARELRFVRLVDFVDEHCGLERAYTGRLRDGVGVKAGMAPVVEAFLKDPSKSSLAKQTNSGIDPIVIPFTYQDIMNVVATFGKDYLLREVRRIQMILAASWAPRAVIDDAQRRLNILKAHFIPLL